MRGSSFFVAMLGCAVLIGGCASERKTYLTNTAFEGRYTDGDFKLREAEHAINRVRMAFLEAGFTVDRRARDSRLLIERSFSITPGRWVTTGEEHTTHPETGQAMTNIERDFVSDGSEAERVTLTGEIIVEGGANEALRGVRYRVWPMSDRVRMPIAGTDPAMNESPYELFTDTLYEVVEELGRGPEEGKRNNG